jgi:hypothetical protein
LSVAVFFSGSMNDFTSVSRMEYAPSNGVSGLEVSASVAAFTAIASTSACRLSFAGPSGIARSSSTAFAASSMSRTFSKASARPAPPPRSWSRSRKPRIFLIGFLVTGSMTGFPSSPISGSWS